MTKEEEKFKPAVELQDGNPQPPASLPEAIQLYSIFGMIEIVTTVPTLTPNNFYGQFKLYTDSLTSPTVYSLYVFLPKLKVWKSVALT